MDKKQNYIAIRRDRFYGDEASRRHGDGLPTILNQDEDVPTIQAAPALKLPVEYLIFPITKKGDWDGMPALKQLWDDTQLASAELTRQAARGQNKRG